jgi:cupin fold WbuC family metalloprotein
MKIELIDESLFGQALARAQASPRRRTNHNFHPTLEDNPHRFLNVMWKGTYITPHRHLDPPKSETFVVLRGEIAFFVFDDAGEVARCEVLAEPGRRHRACGIDLAPGVWHSLAVLSEHAICFEVKPGPYSPARDKDFAPWAPREGDPRAAAYLEDLLRRCGFGGGEAQAEGSPRR